MSIDHRIYPHALTRCYCGHLLEACADCRAWLVKHSPRIAADWLCWTGWDVPLERYRLLSVLADADEDRNRRWWQ